jgi:hypothetical protein
LITFANGIRPKLDPSSIHIFTDATYWSDITSSGELGNYAKVLISFVAPTSDHWQSLTLRLKHSGGKDAYRMPLEVTLGPTTIQLNPSSKSSLTIDDITLYPTPGPGSDHLSFKPGRRNVIVIQFGPWRKIETTLTDGHLLHDVELLDEAGLKDPRNQIINAD